MAGYNSYDNPSMKYAMEMQDARVNVPPPQSRPVTEQQTWSWCSTVWSALVMMCCCPLFGFIGLLCSSFAYVDHKAADHTRSDFKRKCGWGWSMTGLVLGVLLIAGVCVIVVLYNAELMSWYRSVLYK